MGRKKRQLGEMTVAQFKKQLYNERYRSKIKTGEVRRSYIKSSYRGYDIFKTTGAMVRAKTLNEYVKAFKKANKGLINQTGAYLEADAFTDVNDFKKSVNKQLQATLMKQQREKQYNTYINRANSNMLQEIFDNLPPYSQDDIRSVFGAEDINFNDFAWNSDLKGYTNGVILVKIKSNSDGNYEEDTMTASRL